MLNKKKIKYKFITFEGLDGCGKSTQAKLLYDFFLERPENKQKILFLREPGSTNIGEQIRDILIDKKNSNISNKTEVLLFMASRAQLVSEKIIPALKNNFIVICDRFIDSSVAYQGAGRDIDINFVIKLNQFVIEKIKPDITFFLDITPESALKRKLELKDKYQDTDRIETENLIFYKKVYDAYKKICDKNKNRIIKLNGEADISIVHKNIIDTLYKS